jgi:hypothetical protein
VFNEFFKFICDNEINYSNNRTKRGIFIWPYLFDTVKEETLYWKSKLNINYENININLNKYDTIKKFLIDLKKFKKYGIVIDKYYLKNNKNVLPKIYHDLINVLKTGELTINNWNNKKIFKNFINLINSRFNKIKRNAS